MESTIHPPSWYTHFSALSVPHQEVRWLPSVNPHRHIVVTQSPQFTSRFSPAGVHSLPVRAQSLRPVQLFVTLWTVTCQTPLPVDFSRQDYWIGFAISYSRGSTPTRDQILIACAPCAGRQILCLWATWGVQWHGSDVQNCLAALKILYAPPTHPSTTVVSLSP